MKLPRRESCRSCGRFAANKGSVCSGSSKLLSMAEDCWRPEGCLLVFMEEPEEQKNNGKDNKP